MRIYRTECIKTNASPTFAHLAMTEAAISDSESFTFEEAEKMLEEEEEDQRAAREKKAREQQPLPKTLPFQFTKSGTKLQQRKIQTDSEQVEYVLRKLRIKPYKQTELLQVTH